MDIKVLDTADKANSVFAVKLRKLFDESGKTHVSLAKHIDEVSGESITRQAVGQWCSGKTCPSLKIVPIIADFFGVTTDYLLTDTEIKTADTDIKGICEYTGLTEKAVAALEQSYFDGYTNIIKTINFLLEEFTEGFNNENAGKGNPILIDIINCLSISAANTPYKFSFTLKQLSKEEAKEAKENIQYLSEDDLEEIEEILYKWGVAEKGFSEADIYADQILNTALMDMLKNNLQNKKALYLKYIREYRFVHRKPDYKKSDKLPTKGGIAVKTKLFDNNKPTQEQEGGENGEHNGAKG